MTRMQMMMLRAIFAMREVGKEQQEEASCNISSQVEQDQEEEEMSPGQALEWILMANQS